MCECACVHVYVCVRLCVSVRACACVCVCMCTCVCACVCLVQVLSLHAPVCIPSFSHECVSLLCVCVHNYTVLNVCFSSNRLIAAHLPGGLWSRSTPAWRSHTLWPCTAAQCNEERGEFQGAFWHAKCQWVSKQCNHIHSTTYNTFHSLIETQTQTDCAYIILSLNLRMQWHAHTQVTGTR